MVAGLSAYTISLLLPILMYGYLAFLPIPELILDIIVLVAVGVVVGIASALITRRKSRAILTSIVGGILGLLTPYVTFNILQTPILSTILQRAPPYYMIILPPATAALFSLAYLSITKPLLKTVKEAEEEKEMVGEGKEKLELEEKEVVKEHEVEEKPIEVVKEIKPGEVSGVGQEPELDILKELVKEIEKETKVEEAPAVEEATRMEESLKKCKHCGELIPSDSIYCPLCGGYQGKE